MADESYPSLPAGMQLRTYRPGDDNTAYVRIYNLIYSPERTTTEQEMYWDSIYPQENPRLRHTAENADGQVVAASVCLRPFWMDAPGVYWLEIMVHPEWQRRGIGRAMLAALEAFACRQGAAILRTNCREDFAGAIRFLERAGFTNIGIRYESVIDVQTFDETPFLPALEGVLGAGYRLTPAAELDPADADRQLLTVSQQRLSAVPGEVPARFRELAQSQPGRRAIRVAVASGG
jgi:ribosomal protein S18 acetylase RimI-like enzyme